MLVSTNHLVSHQDKKLSISLLFNIKSKDNANYAYAVDIEMKMSDGFGAVSRDSKRINEIVSNHFVAAMAPVIDYQSNLFTAEQAKDIANQKGTDLMLPQENLIELKRLQKAATKRLMQGMIHLDVAGVVNCNESGMRIKSVSFFP